jgi:hypothetical protein
MITSLFKKIYAIKFFSLVVLILSVFSLSNSGFGLDRIGLIDYSKVGLLFVLLGSVFDFISTKMD